VIASMFSLDSRLAELRPTEHELRTARQLRDAAAPARHPAPATRRVLAQTAGQKRLSRATAS
jgi:hypothetical protein